MFEKTHKTFKGRAGKSMKDMYRVFVQNKGLIEKYPENMMRAMGYFEFFYMDQLDKKKTSIKRFKEKYPDSKYAINEERSRELARKSTGGFKTAKEIMTNPKADYNKNKN